MLTHNAILVGRANMINENKLQHQHYLKTLYQQSSIVTRQRHSMAEVYGEILATSVTKILSQFKWTEADVFIDFGSGLGKLVAQVFLETSIKAAYGIEVVPEFHQLAWQATQSIQQDFPDLFIHRTLQFECADFLQTSLPPATFAIINATCFSQSLLCALGRLINQMPNIHTVFSLRPLPTLKRLIFKKSILIECSWDSSLCFMYQVPDPAPGPSLGLKARGTTVP